MKSKKGLDFLRRISLCVRKSNGERKAVARISFSVFQMQYSRLFNVKWI